jgi:PAS domain S-box-containing protein
MFLEKTPIKRRLMLAILLTSVTVLILTSTAFVIYELIASREELERNLHMTAQIISAQSTTSLIFDNNNDAHQLLSSLKFVPNMERAALYDAESKLFARYPTNAALSGFPASAPPLGRTFNLSHVLWSESVVSDNKRVGTLYLQSNLAPIYDRLRLYSLIGALVMATSFLVALLLSKLLQKSISHPILELAKTARIISERRDYTVRARKSTEDELGLLTDAFNHMLGQIQNREAALRESTQRLQLALQASQTGTWDWDIQTNRVDWDEFIYRQLGVEPGQSEQTFESFIRAVHPDDRESVSRAVQMAYENRGEFDAEFRVVWPDQSVHYLVTRGKAICNADGRAVRMTGVSLEITASKRAEEVHALLAAIVESSDDAIIGKDLQGNVISWNAGAERMFGYAAGEVLGRPVSLLTPPDRMGEEEGVLERMRAGSEVERYETVRIRKDSRVVQVSLSVSPIRNAHGEMVGVSAISRDITERKHAEAILARQAAVLSEQAQLLDLANVLARDLQGRIILWSAGMEQTYGWSRAEALGKFPQELLASEFPEPPEHISARVLQEGEWMGELVHRHRNGQQIIVASRWVLHKDDHGRPAAILEVDNNITARKRAEEEIRRLNAELEQRVRERTAELTEANRELEAFTYSVSHDLRAPLRHIDAFARIVEEEVPADQNPELCNYISRIRKGTQTMGRLVDDLLNLSRVGRAQPGWARVDLNLVLQEVLADLKGETTGRHIEWRLEPLPTAECDPGLIKQVFANLLSNAIKYTRPRNPAVIEVGQTFKEGQPAVYVRDNGVGFSMKYVHKLFGVFERLHRPEEFEGTGIGLAIVRRIIQKHSGRVWAEAEPDKGATFYFTLQGLPAAADATGKKSSLPASLS